MSAVIDEGASGAVGELQVDDLASRAVRGVGWNAGAQVGRQVVQTMLSVVVARLLVPADFGQVAQVVVLAGMATMLSDFGFGAALVQRRELTEGHRSSVFWLQAGLGLVFAVAVAAVAPLIAAFYDDPGLVRVTVLLAPTFLIASLSTVQRSLLTRELRFRATAVVDVSALALSGAACVLAAERGWGVTSIVVQNLALATVTTVLLWLASPWRPSARFERAAIRDLLPYSRNLLGFTFVNYAIRNSDNLLVGRLMGAVALGLYTRGYSILLYPNRQISAVVGKVMFASLSRISDDVDRLRRAYLRAIAVIALVTFPLMVGLAMTATEFVPVVLGQQWTDAIPIIRIFCILGASESIVTTVGWIYQATGRTDVLFRWGLAVGGIPLLGIVVGSLGGTIESVTYGYALSGVVLLHPCFHAAGKLIGMTFGDVLRALWPGAACACAMAGVVAGVGALLPTGLSLAAVLGAKVLAGVVAYAALVHAFRVPAYRELVSALRAGRRPA